MDKQLYSNDVLQHVLTTAAKSDVMQEAIIVMAVLEVEGIFAVPSKPSQSDKKIIVGELIARLLLAKQAGSDKRFAGQYTPSSLENLPRWMKKTSDDSYQVDISYNSGCHKLFDRHINTEAGIMGLLRDWWGGFSNSDFVAVVRAVRAFHTINRELRFGAGELENRELQKWCDRHLLVYRKLCAIYREIHYISEAMKKMNLPFPNELLRERDFDGNALTKSLAAGLTDGISRLMLASIGSLAYQSSSGDDFWVAHASCVSRMRNCDLILAANLRTINSRSGELMLANLAAPLKPEWLAESDQLVKSAKEALAQPATAAGTIHNTFADEFVVLHDFGGVYKNGPRSSNNRANRTIRLQDRSYYWVIERNGVRRKPDRNNPMIAAVGDGVMMWDYVLNEEVALQLLGGNFKVVHQPARLSLQQVAAVRNIEKEIGAPDALALNRAHAADTTAARRCG